MYWHLLWTLPGLFVFFSCQKLGFVVAGRVYTSIAKLYWRFTACPPRLYFSLLYLVSDAMSLAGGRFLGACVATVGASVARDRLAPSASKDTCRGDGTEGDSFLHGHGHGHRARGVSRAGPARRGCGDEGVRGNQGEGKRES